MFLKSLSLSNFLSYGPDTCEIPLGDLNVLVGPNGSGKSNLIEAVSLLRSTPRQLISPVNKGGGVGDWLWKGASKGLPVASISTVIANKNQRDLDFQYELSFTSVQERFEILREEIRTKRPFGANKKVFIYYEHDIDRRHTIISARQMKGGKAISRKLQREDIEPNASILAQRKDPIAYPEITFLGRQFDAVKIYREWHFGATSEIRQPQPTDTDVSHLSEDCLNLAMVINRLQESNSLRDKMREYVKDVYDGAREVSTRIEGGRALALLSEEGLDKAIPANRLSDGTLRYLCLIAILLDPNPAPLVCIDEPELGLHPDLIIRLADMLKDAATRTQLIVTTHSPLLLSEFDATPEVIRVCEKRNGVSTVEKFSKKQLRNWIDSHGSLGGVWRSGEMGGNRW